jgi:uncharacterized iron-regulated protein
MQWMRWGLLLSLVAAQGSDLNLYTHRGKPTSYKALLSRAAKADIIFFGELHNSTEAHALQQQLLNDLIRLKNGKVLLGLEMFERDQQEVLIAYQRREIPTPQALSEKTRVWPNFLSDYAPLIETARRHGVPIYATNAPREIARAVSKEGLTALNALPSLHRGWLAPLPLLRLDSLPSYQAMGEMATQHGLDPEPFRLAQMLKDATMAYTIIQALQPTYTFLHINGSYHSDYGEGIVAYLHAYWGPKVAKTKKILIISTVALPPGEKYQPEARKRADFILVVPPVSSSQMP